VSSNLCCTPLTYVCQLIKNLQIRSTSSHQSKERKTKWDQYLVCVAFSCLSWVMIWFTGKQRHVCLKIWRDIISILMCAGWNMLLSSFAVQLRCGTSWDATTCGGREPGVLRPVPSIQNRSSAPRPLALHSILHVLNIGISSRFDQVFHILNEDKFVLPYLLCEKPSSVIECEVWMFHGLPTFWNQAILQPKVVAYVMISLGTCGRNNILPVH
jgi:hypothetical protein